jgi:hypothetical protein
VLAAGRCPCVFRTICHWQWQILRFGLVAHLLDGIATWSLDSLLRMDAEFIIAVEVAFRRGLEEPDAAARTYENFPKR